MTAFHYYSGKTYLEAVWEPIYLKNNNDPRSDVGKKWVIQIKDALDKFLIPPEKNFHFHTNVFFYFDEGFEKKSISRELQLNLYRIGQEAIRNIIKYANATEIKVELILYRKNMNLLISDNGVGFDTRKVTTGIGLANIKRRSEFFNGSFSIYSTPGEGCEIVVKIPLQQNNTSGPNSSQIKSIPKELIQMHKPADRKGMGVGLY